MQKKESSFFTLVELLVVIAVFSILISMLQPALKRAWEKGYGLACQGNLKQLATASVMYTEDNNDYLPPEFFSDSAGNVVWPWNWMVVLNPYLPSQVLEHGKRPKGEWACPSSKALVCAESYSDYGKNRVLGYNSGKIEWWVSSVRVGKINKPNQVFYIADNTNNLNSACVRSITPYFWTFPQGNLGARHANNFNVLYADFHVDSQSLVDVTFPATMSAAYTISVPLPWGWDQ